MVWSADQLSVAEFVRIPVKPGAESEFSRIPLQSTPRRPDNIVRPPTISPAILACHDVPLFDKLRPGEVTEWSIVLVSKTSRGASLSGVRIPPSPLV